MTFNTTRNFAREMDASDSLAHFRDRFVITDPDLIYLDGNSLGRLPKITSNLTQQLVEEMWGQRLIRGWNEGWMELQEKIGAKMATLLGAAADEIIIADATSVNLFKLATAAVNFKKGRHKIVTDNLNFPSDLYILQGVAQNAGRPLTIEVVPSADGIHGPVAGLKQAIDQETALVSLSHTVFKSAYTYNMQEITAVAHQAGAAMLWDMSHSVGSVLTDLHAAGATLAVGCTYKYVNGGPGSPAFMYIRRDWQEKLSNPITGWMGHQAIFDFDLRYERDPGLRHFLTGTPPILSTATIEPGLDLILEAGMENLRAKSVQQTAYLIYLWQEWLAPLGFSLFTPTEASMRGSHVSLSHPEAWLIDQALIQELNVIPDFRAPDKIRFGIAPLYTTYLEIFEGMDRLRRAVSERLYQKYSEISKLVT